MTYLIGFILLALIIFAAIKPKWAIFLVLALIPFHAFIITAKTQFLGLSGFHSNMLAFWKEAILIGLTLNMIWRVAKTEKQAYKILKVDKLIFGLLIIAIISYFVFTKKLAQGIWGLRLDFEMFLIYAVIRSFRWDKEEVKKIIYIVLVSAAIVVMFALMQRFFLPKDFLVHFGYYSDPNYVLGQALPAYQQIGASGVFRVQSFLSGPNQLGAYLVIILSLVLSLFLWIKDQNKKIILGLFAVLVVMALFFTYSRSAWISAGVVVILISVIWAYFEKNKKFALVLLGVYLIVLIAGFFILRSNLVNSNFVDTYLKHQGSNIERSDRVQTSYQKIIANPLGLGLGKAGLASFRYDKKPVIPENWYLQMALEFGLLGFLVYISIVFEFLKKMWGFAKKTFGEYNFGINLGVFLAFLGLSVYSLFLQTWSDATTFFVMFILIGVVYSANLKKV